MATLETEVPPEPQAQLAYPAAPPFLAGHEDHLRVYHALRAATEEEGGALLAALRAVAQSDDAPLVFQLRRAPHPCGPCLDTVPHIGFPAAVLPDQRLVQRVLQL